MHIEVDDLTRAEVHALIAEHLADMHATSPPESVHALGLAALRDPAITVWTAWDGPAVLGCAALKQLSSTEGEIKAMRTATAARSRGVATALLTHLLAQARDRGYHRISLETGTQDFFTPAHAFYQRHGFISCGPFADYSPDPNSRYFTRSL